MSHVFRLLGIFSFLLGLLIVPSGKAVAGRVISEIPLSEVEAKEATLAPKPGDHGGGGGGKAEVPASLEIAIQTLERHDQSVPQE